MFGNFGAIFGAKSVVALEQACPLLSGSTYWLAPVIRPSTRTGREQTCSRVAQ